MKMHNVLYMAGIALLIASAGNVMLPMEESKPPLTPQGLSKGAQSLLSKKYIFRARSGEQKGYARSVALGAWEGEKWGAGVAGATVLGLMATGRLSPKEKQDSLQTVTGVIAGVSAAGVLAGTAISMLQEMQKNSSPAWIAQIDLLEKFRNKISDELLYMGIPSDKLETKDEKAIQNAVQKYGKAYFMLARIFHSTSRQNVSFLHVTHCL